VLQHRNPTWCLIVSEVAADHIVMTCLANVLAKILALSSVALTAAVLELKQDQTHAHQHRGLSFQSVTATTENEFELSPKSRGADHKGQAKRRVGSVGGFRLDGEPSFASTACSLIEGQFHSPESLSSTECTCTLSAMHSSAVKFGCEQSEVMCNKDKDRSEKKVCARLVHTGTVSLENPVLSSDVCLKDLRISGKKQGDLCLSLEYEKRDTLKKCRARIGDRNCQCSVCDDGMGVRLDCSSVDPSLVSPHCDEISVITSVLGEVSSIQHYLPTFLK
jgi:hypothetical protein